MMLCPQCGNPVIAVFHEWRGQSNEAYFEYLHEEIGGYRPEPCEVTLPYGEGLTQYAKEWEEMYPNAS